MVGEKKKNSYRKKRKGFSGVQRYGKANSERTENIAETSQMPETSTQDDDNEPMCVGASRKKMKIDAAKQPDLTGLHEDEYRLISLRNLNSLLSKFHGCEEGN